MSRFIPLTDTDVILETYPRLNDGFANIESEVDDTNDRITDHTNGTSERHNASDVDNDSTVTGTTVEDALDTLKGALDTAVLAASNADIGVFSINGTGTNTITGTYTNLTYFGGLKINLKIANDNTGSATFNLNTLGAKTIKKINIRGEKVNLEKQDLIANSVVPIEYDGTDFVAYIKDERIKVISGILHYYDSEIEEYRAIETERYYGLEWNQTLGTYKRLGGAVGLVAQASTPTNRTPQNDFDSIYPWSDIKRCNLADNGTVNDYFGDVGYIEDGTNGQVMVEIPKFYSRYEYATNPAGDRIVRWYISEEEITGFTALDKAFIRNGNNNDYYYIGAFDANAYDVSGTAYITDDSQIVDFTASTGDILSSIAGVKPLSGASQSAHIVNCRTIAQNRGTSWQLQDFLGSTAIELLLLIEYGTFNSQGVIGQGITGKASGSGNESENTGATSFLGNVSGRADGTNNLSAISYRGIENFWGNINNWVDGLNIKADRQPWVADYGFESNKFSSPYSDLGVTLPSSNGFVTNIHDLQNAFLPSAVGGSSSTGLFDSYFQNTGNRVARLGGDWIGALVAGAWCWALNNDSSFSFRAVGARLAFIPNT
jgi:hypothetical protein